MIRILLLNPNTSASVTDLMAKVARTAAAPDTEIVAVSASRGMPYIATRAEAAIGAATVLEMLAEREGSFDAAIIAAFGDPGLGGARELMLKPVVGLAEASMLSACMLGRRFSIVSFSRALGPWFRECVEAHGLLSRLASIRLLDSPFVSVGDVGAEKEDLLVDLARRAIEEDEADVIVLAGAPLAGLAERVKSRVDVPIIEGVAAAVKQAELLIGLDTRKAIAGTYRRPAAKTSQGLPDSLARLFAAGAPPIVR
jgi:allantoin racemase